jgi:hypothetical protein
LAARSGRETVTFADLEMAVGRVRGRRQEKLSLEAREDKWRVAVHEIGHLSASFAFPCLERIESLSLYSPYNPDWFSRGKAGLPEVVRKETAKGTLAVLLAGRAAESVFFNEVSSLSESDIAIATALAHEMVTRWGMNEDIGLINDRLLRGFALTELAQEGAAHISLETERYAKENDEMKRFLDEAYHLATEHVEKHAGQITDWAARLFEHETLGHHWIEQIRSTSVFTSQMRVPLSTKPGATSSTPTEKSPSAEPNRREKAAAPADLEDNDYQHKTMSILRRKKEILDMQIAALGINAPPHLVIQMEDVNEDIRKLETTRRDPELEQAT